MATHNGARFVAAQVASILRQTRPVDEIVLSDDASTDGTPEIAAALVAEGDAAAIGTGSAGVRRRYGCCAMRLRWV